MVVKDALEAPVISTGDAWTRNEIDRFVLKELSQRNLDPSKEASLGLDSQVDTIDLTSNPDEIDAFLSH